MEYNNLQAVPDPVAELLQQRRDPLVRSRALVLESPALGEVLDRQQELVACRRRADGPSAH